MRPSWPVVLACAAAASGGRRSLIKIDNQNMRDESIDPEEYLWETLPGRCCFQELVDQCDLCSVWSDPENFCHMSADNCEQCGMQLYCEPPPALLDANKVCVGESRVALGWGRACWCFYRCNLCRGSANPATKRPPNWPMTKTS